MNILSLEEVRFAYPGQPPVLDGVRFALNQGDRAGVIGPNGAGKSTLLRIAMGLLRPEELTLVPGFESFSPDSARANGLRAAHSRAVAARVRCLRMWSFLVCCG